MHAAACLIDEGNPALNDFSDSLLPIAKPRSMLRRALQQLELVNKHLGVDR